MSAPYEAIHQAIEQRWAAQWDTGAVPTRYEHGPNASPNGAGEYTVLSTRFGGADRLSIGYQTPLTREAGVVFIQIIAPTGKGARRLHALAEQAADVWRGLADSLLELSAGSVQLLFEPPSVGGNLAGDAGYAQITVRAPFRFTY